jgi:hypothetical protein
MPSNVQNAIKIMTLAMLLNQGNGGYIWVLYSFFKGLKNIYISDN